MPSTKVLAFLQNQWFPNPDRVRAIYASHSGDRERICKLNAAYLFMGCLTGKRIRQAFGEDMRHVITYEEASSQIGGASGSAFPAEPQHIKDAIDFWHPEIVIAFGRIAGGGVLQAMRLFTEKYSFYFTVAPHPAARHTTVMADLRSVANDVRTRIGMSPVPSRPPAPG